MLGTKLVHRLLCLSSPFKQLGGTLSQGRQTGADSTPDVPACRAPFALEVALQVQPEAAAVEGARYHMLTLAEGY